MTCSRDKKREDMFPPCIFRCARFKHGGFNASGVFSNKNKVVIDDYIKSDYCNPY